jgi:hypothetical protein
MCTVEPRKSIVDDAIQTGKDDVLFVVQCGHGRVGISIVRETNKAEAPAATGVAVLDNDL